MTTKKQTREDVRRTVRQLVGGAFKPESGTVVRTHNGQGLDGFLDEHAPLEVRDEWRRIAAQGALLDVSADTVMAETRAVLGLRDTDSARFIARAAERLLFLDATLRAALTNQGRWRDRAHAAEHRATTTASDARAIGDPSEAALREFARRVLEAALELRESGGDA